MIRVDLAHPSDFDGWREAARRLLGARAAPEDIVWQVKGEAEDLFAAPAGVLPDIEGGAAPRVPRAFPDLARYAICHGHPERFALLYRVLLRLQDQPRLLDLATDDDVHAANALVKAVSRERHKMTAFVRFRELAGDDGAESAFVAWFEPEHHVVRLTAPFFRDRFANMRWSILTPDVCVHWDRTALRFTPGVTQDKAPAADRLEDFWRTYYASIFNPARLKVAAMKREMPMRYRKNLPESSLIPSLIERAEGRSVAMVEAAPTLAPRRSPRIVARTEAARAPAEPLEGLDGLRQLAAGCKRCPLWANATQTVFGEGQAEAELLFVGEQPGDNEDLTGRPFTGPAGQIFDRALAQAGISRERAYVTNAVKHFKNEPHGKRRLHKSPNVSEINACRWWLEQETARLKPRLAIALGASAVRSLTGESHVMTHVRGQVLSSPFAGHVFVTIHPSYLLRLQDSEDREREFAAFVRDLSTAREIACGI